MSKPSLALFNPSPLPTVYLPRLISFGTYIAYTDNGGYFLAVDFPLIFWRGDVRRVNEKNTKKNNTALEKRNELTSFCIVVCAG